jgi:curved DNA-binding protein CbpA
MDDRVAGQRTRPLTFYEVLQVSPQADAEVIAAAYRALARRYHPDVNSGPGAAEQMREINAAYQVLSDPKRRARYDRQRGRPTRMHHAEAATAPTAHRTAQRPAPAPPRRSAARVPNVASPRDTRTRAPLTRAILAFMVIAILLAVFALAAWALFSALDESPNDLLRAGIDIVQ